MKSGLEQLVEWHDNRPQHIKGSIYFDERFIRKARALLAEEQAQSDNRPAVSCREADLADWLEHKEAFKAWFKSKGQAQKNVGDKNIEDVIFGAIKTEYENGGTYRLYRRLTNAVVNAIFLHRSSVNDEPLEELAKRKGWKIIGIFGKANGGKGSNYLGYLKQTRAYLSKLPDVKREGI